MSRSIIQTYNQTTQQLNENSTFSLGSVSRRFGGNCRLNGNSIELNGCGYYTLDANITLAPTAEGDVTITLYQNGTEIPGATATATQAAGENVTLTINNTVRVNCNVVAITCVLEQGASTVSNITLRAQKI